MINSRTMFFLGGHDLEMLTILELLQIHAPDRFIDNGLSWGAKASAYSQGIQECLMRGEIPVLVELEDDIGLGDAGVIIVDHHGPLAGTDAHTALHQVFNLLDLPEEAWNRHMELVAANDRGHITGMLAVGATQEEIIAIRAADRMAQGITEEEDKAGEAALGTLQVHCQGQLTVVRLPHNRAATVADRLEPALGGPGFKNLFVISPGEVNFFGNGEIVHALDKAFPGGWYGGSLPERGFWGHSCPSEGILPFLIEYDYGS